MKQVVITGATGAIGRALITESIKNGYEVLAVVHRSSQRAKDLENIEHCRVLRLDLSEYRDALAEMEKQGIAWGTNSSKLMNPVEAKPADLSDSTDIAINRTQANSGNIFFHLAWEAPFGAGRDDLKLQMRNVRAAVEAVDFARKLGCQTFVGTGSQAEYGRVERNYREAYGTLERINPALYDHAENSAETDGDFALHKASENRDGTNTKDKYRRISAVSEGLRLRPDTPTNPETGYGSAKLCAGYLTRYYAEQSGMRHIWARILSVYGPYDRAETMISTAVSRMMRNEETEFSPCEQIWDYLYSEDAARALLLAGEKGISGKTYVVGSGEAHPLRWYIEKIAEITGYTKEIGFGKRPYNDKQVMHLVADISELTEDTGFRPMVDFETGIRNMISCQ